MRRPLSLAVYGVATRAVTPLLPLLLGLRLLRGKEMRGRTGERRGRAGQARPAGRLVWMHGASVGETVSLLPLVERFLALGFRVLMTSGTVSSATMMARRLPEGATHQFIPLDAPRYVAQFLDHWRPDLGIIAESELWPNTILAAHARSLPLALVNARMSDRSFARWQRLRGLIGALLERFDLCLAQSHTDAERLRRLGAPRVTATGNLKFDVPLPTVGEEARVALETALGSRPVWLAASTHAGEELAALATHKALRAETQSLLTILAPRHPERGAALVEAARREGLDACRRSEGALPTTGTDIYVADTLGELPLLYALSDVAFVGGSLVRIGGHNPIEPAKLGAAILTGPHTRNFRDVYAALLGAGAAVEIADADALASALRSLLAEPERRARMTEAARGVVDGLTGAVGRTMQLLEPLCLHASLESSSAS